MDEQLLSQKLVDLLQVAEKLCKRDDNFELKAPGSSAAMQLFMRKTLELYLLMQNEPATKSNPKLCDYLNKSASLLSAKGAFRFRGYHITMFLMDLSDTLAHSFYGGEWETVVCPKRSQIEAFNEIYKETSYKEFVDEDLEDIDTEIKRVGGVEGFLSQEQIPHGMPFSHWWWWYPNEPY